MMIPMTTATTLTRPGAMSQVGSPDTALTYLWDPASGRFHPTRHDRAGMDPRRSRSRGGNQPYYVVQGAGRHRRPRQGGLQNRLGHPAIRTTTLGRHLAP